MYAAIFGFFGTVWFGWAQERPPKSWHLPLAVGSIVSGMLTFGGLYLAATNWSGASALNSRDDYITFGMVVAVEFALAGIGAGILAARKKPVYIPAWIAFVVGVHFLPLAWIFQDTALYVLTVLAVLAPIVSVPLAKKTGIALSAIVGAGMGIVLVGFALRGLILALI